MKDEYQLPSAYLYNLIYVAQEALLQDLMRSHAGPGVLSRGSLEILSTADHLFLHMACAETKDSRLESRNMRIKTWNPPVPPPGRPGKIAQRYSSKIGNAKNREDNTLRMTPVNSLLAQ